MKKLLSLLMCAALISSVASGCGVEKTPETTVAETVEVEVPYESEPVLKKYEGVQLRMLSMVWENDPQAQAILQAARVFEKQTGAVVQVLWAADASAGVDGCDIFQVEGEKLAGTLLTQALDLSQMAQMAGYEQHSFQALRQQVIGRCGYLAGIAQVPYVGGIYYIEDVFESCGIVQAPAGWDEFLSVCRTLRENGYEPLALNSEDTAMAAQLHLERSLGAGQLVKAEDDQSKFAEDEQLIQAAQQIVDFVAAGNLASGTPAAYPAAQSKLGLSNAVMTVGSNKLCDQVEETACADLKWGVFSWPGSGDGCGSFVDSDVLCVNSDSSNAQAAFDFIMLLCTGEFDQLRADICGGIPADPANQSAIAGAVEVLLASGSWDEALLVGVPESVFSRLWEGKYKSGVQFADAWDQSR